MMFKRDRKTIICDAEKCTGCEICEFACSIEHDDVFQQMHSRIKRVRIEPIINFAISCQFCKDPACVRVCPQKALSQDDATGRILVDENKCDGCAFCIKACPFGAIIINMRNNKAQMCDQCYEREDGPACVQYCPKEALIFTTLEAYADEKRFDSVEKLLKEYAEIGELESQAK
ncbi:MAG: 4Fe-4S dicluster domain-containing protein [Candidatus Helarchaeota archaeon]